MINAEFPQSPIFDYRALRLLVGFVAFSLPVIALINSSTPISSISASYHTENRDIFVGSLFVVGALLWAYNGHTLRQKYISKFASVAAIVAALYPTSCSLCEPDIYSMIHFVAAVILFSTIAYFCLGPFRMKTKEKNWKEAKRRGTVYLICGLTIVGSMLFAVLTEFTMSEVTRKALAITFWAELVALIAFGFAWLTAGKVSRLLSNDDERLRLSLK